MNISSLVWKYEIVSELCSRNDFGTDGRNDGMTEWRTDGRHLNLYPPSTSWWGIIIILIIIIIIIIIINRRKTIGYPTHSTGYPNNNTGAGRMASSYAHSPLSCPACVWILTKLSSRYFTGRAIHQCVPFLAWMLNYAFRMLVWFGWC